MLSKNISTSPPHEHAKILDNLKLSTKEGILDSELLKVYEEESIRAETIISIYQKEKRKRGKFTYQKLPQSNKQPVKESIKNANLFRKTIAKITLRD